MLAIKLPPVSENPSYAPALIASGLHTYNLQAGGACFACPLLHPIYIFHLVDLAIYLHTCYGVVSKVVKGQTLQP